MCWGRVSVCVCNHACVCVHVCSYTCVRYATYKTIHPHPLLSVTWLPHGASVGTNPSPLGASTLPRAPVLHGPTSHHQGHHTGTGTKLRIILLYLDVMMM